MLSCDEGQLELITALAKVSERARNYYSRVRTSFRWPYFGIAEIHSITKPTLDYHVDCSIYSCRFGVGVTVSRVGLDELDILVYFRFERPCSVDLYPRYRL